MNRKNPPQKRAELDRAWNAGFESAIKQMRDQIDRLDLDYDVKTNLLVKLKKISKVTLITEPRTPVADIISEEKGLDEKESSDKKDRSG